jgi:hypothetical protein
MAVEPNEVGSIKRQITSLRRRLHILQERKAKEGSEVSPKVIIEIR